jgi:hypothetical protein
MDPAAPEHAKNIWTNTTPSAVPVSLSFEKKVGKVVAATTVNAEIKGREDVPAGSKAFVRNEPAVTKVDATETEIASVGRVIVEGDVSSSTAISDIVAIFWSSTLSVSSFGQSAVAMSAVELSVAVVSSSPDFEIENKKAKYSATTTLSAATATSRKMEGGKVRRSKHTY